MDKDLFTTANVWLTNSCILYVLLYKVESIIMFTTAIIIFIFAFKSSVEQPPQAADGKK